jgi:anti-anti-sigma factor
MTDESFFRTSTLDDDILVIRLHGKLDVTTTPEFSQQVEQHFAEGKRRIIIDCANLGFISSVGVGALVTLQAKLRKQGGEVKLAALQGPVADVLKVVRMDKMMGIYGDAEFARQSFYKGQNK